jgi:hypothetical protein
MDMSEDQRTWNYRVIRHADGSLALHEVYYDATGRAVAMTENPVSFGVTEEETQADLIRTLDRALKDARERPVLEAAEIGTSA